MGLEGGSARPVYLVDANGNTLIGTNSMVPVTLATRLDYGQDSINIGAVGGATPVGGFTALASAARTASTQSADFVNTGYKGIVLHFNMTAVPGVDTVTPTIDCKDPISGNYKQIYSLGSAIVATGYRAYCIVPGSPSAGAWTAAVSGIIPAIWRVNMTHSAGTSFTYSVYISTFTGA